MKNLFDYATKELSQDAFLRWFIEKYKDKAIGQMSKEFLCALINTKLKLANPNDIDNVTTEAQENNIDIVVKFELNKKQCIMAIEDKTVSGPHDDQLNRYVNYLNKKYTNHEKYFVLYKTGYVNEEERNYISTSGWELFSIDDIINFFKPYKGNTKSEILENYIEHVSDIDKALRFQDEKNVLNWNLSNWQGYVNSKWPKYNDPDRAYLWVNCYRGAYYSICFQKSLRDDESSDALVLEIFVREHKNLSAYLHHAFYDPVDKKRKWAVKNLKETNKNFIRKQTELAKRLREFALNDSKCRNQLVAVRDNATNCFAKIKEIVQIQDLNCLNNTIDAWKELFEKIVNEFSLEYNK